MSSSRSMILAPGEGDSFTIGPFQFLTRVAGSQSNGLFELYELNFGQGTIDYHVHNTMDETICVVSGEIEYMLEGKKYPRAAGSVGYVPRGLHHGFTNQGPGKATVLLLFTPSRNQNEYLREFEKLAAKSPLDKAALQTLQKQYDQVLIPWPG